jgi:hypothetical protein
MPSEEFDIKPKVIKVTKLIQGEKGQISKLDDKDLFGTGIVE